ncbi:MAG: response regulator [Nitrosopumilus sp.]|nr:response regulator [Nitrosopumilus sp.]MDH3386128.1 response regulator [Nitrosopumilus sp.]
MKVLIIDDSDIICNLYSEQLRLQGDVVTAVNDGKEGLDLLAENDYDLILLDMCMPDYSGIQFLEDLEKSRPSEIKKISVISRRSHDDNLTAKLEAFGIKSIQEKPPTVMHLENIG